LLICIPLSLLPHEDNNSNFLFLGLCRVPSVLLALPQLVGSSWQSLHSLCGPLLADFLLIMKRH
jgi:hypothetical protein